MFSGGEFASERVQSAMPGAADEDFSLSVVPSKVGTTEEKSGAPDSSGLLF